MAIQRITAKKMTKGADGVWRPGSPRTRKGRGFRGVRLPATHGHTSVNGHDAGGAYVEWYADDDGGSGYGSKPMVQRWYPTADAPTPREPPRDGWAPLLATDEPDRTDPGYWKDNY